MFCSYGYFPVPVVNSSLPCFSLYNAVWNIHLSAKCWEPHHNLTKINATKGFHSLNFIFINRLAPGSQLNMLREPKKSLFASYYVF